MPGNYGLAIKEGTNEKRDFAGDFHRANGRVRARAVRACGQTEETRRREDRAYFGAWMTDVRFSPIRDADALAKLPEGERGEWQELWGGVDLWLRNNP